MTSQKCPCVHIWVNIQNKQLTGFDLYSYLPLKCSYSRRVNTFFFLIKMSDIGGKPTSISLKPLDNIGKTEKQKCSQIYT